MVFQSYALYPHMSVEENISYSMTLRKSPKEKIKGAVTSVSNILGLSALLERRPKALSGGQRQRVAMGRAIVRDPQAFLFDEPLSNLDARLREQMRSEIRKLHRKLKATSIYVTHDQIEAMTMADRIVAMHDGYIQQVGTPLEIYDRPANIFVASFIGSPAMNFIEGVAIATDEGYYLKTKENEHIDLPKCADLKDQVGVTLGIRSEHLALAEQGPVTLSATVELIEPMGLSTLIHARVGERSSQFLHWNAQTSPRVHACISPTRKKSCICLIVKQKCGWNLPIDASLDGVGVLGEDSISSFWKMRSTIPVRLF